MIPVLDKFFRSCQAEKDEISWFPQAAFDLVVLCLVFPPLSAWPLFVNRERSAVAYDVVS